MSELKLTVNKLKNYLGTGLKFKLLFDIHEEMYNTLGHCEGFEDVFKEGSIWEMEGWTDIAIPAGDGDLEDAILSNNHFYTSADQFFKPICYRLSDLDKHIPELGFVPVEKLFPIDTEFEKDLGIKSMDYMEYLLCDGVNSFNYDIFQKLFEWHFWPFGEEYFDKGLVIDKLKHGKEVGNG